MGRLVVSAARPLTGAGLAPVAVVRVAGPPAGLPLRRADGRPVAPPAPGRARLACLCDERGGVIDEVLVVGREGGLELHLHGGEAVMERALEVLARHGVSTEERVRATAPSCWRQARAELSARDGPMAELVRAATGAERAGLVDADLAGRAAASLELAPFARALRRAPVVRLVGAPNAGKSTLFNALLGLERALTSPVAGTTRDAVCATWSLRGVPVDLEDTAGGAALRDAGADLTVELLSEPDDRPTHPAALAAWGRSDLHDHPCALRVSGRTGEGLELLRRSIAERLGLPEDPRADLLVPLDPRHEALLERVAALPVRRRAPIGGDRREGAL